MPGSSYGSLFKISTWGESHGEGIGVVVDGCPAGLPLKEADIQKELNRRKTGQSKVTTMRKETDRIRILSGILAGLRFSGPGWCRRGPRVVCVSRHGYVDFGFNADCGRHRRAWKP